MHEILRTAFVSNSTDDIHSSQIYSLSASQEMSRLYKNVTGPCRIHTHSIFKIHFNIILLPTTRSTNIAD